MLEGIKNEFTELGGMMMIQDKYRLINLTLHLLKFLIKPIPTAPLPPPTHSLIHPPDAQIRSKETTTKAKAITSRKDPKA
jgi:hypothetical protein